MNQTKKMRTAGGVDFRKHQLIQAIGCLPKKMLAMGGRDNVSEFVLHELGIGFDLARAAYVIDNPDFDCLKGIAGFNHEHAYVSDSSIWQDPEPFTAHMRNDEFNQQVRGLVRPSLVKSQVADADIVSAIAGGLGFKNPHFYAWPVKHGNHGLLLYEKNDQGSCDCDFLLDGLCLLGFCPVF